MKYQELLILLPCHSLEDFPTYHEGDEADGLLAAWSAMWHPAFLAAAEKKPGWCRVDTPPPSLAERLLIVPAVSISQLPTGFAQRAKEEGGCLIRKISRREEIVAAGLEQLDGGAGVVEPDLALDFLALGYCYLQVQLLTRQMRYASNLDEIHFQNQVVTGAVAAMNGDGTTAREKLTACFQLLAQERDHYYPVDAYLLDLTLTAPTTIGESLRQELASGQPVNLLLSGETLALIAEKEPSTFTALQQAVTAGQATIIGGEVAERRLPLLSCETILSELRRGGGEYEKLLGQRPAIFGRRRFGLTPALPQILHKLGFVGALHATLDDGRFPQGSQFKTRWEGSDGTAIDAIARVPLDAAAPKTFLGLAMKLGESMESDNVATLVLAHWPGQASPWLADVRRMAKYTPALGKYVTLETYFRDTVLPGQLDKFEAGQYRSPYLKQAIIRRHVDPISSVVRYWQRCFRTEAIHALNTLASLLPGITPSTSESPASQLLAQVDQVTDETADTPLDESLAAAATDAAQNFAHTLPRTTQPVQWGVLVLNPHSFVRRIGVDVSSFDRLPDVAKPVYIADEAGAAKYAVVDVPPLGFAWLAPGNPPPKAKRPPPALAEGTLLRNEFFEAIINPTTGTLQALREHNTRGNRMSQQLALRTPGGAGKPGDAWSDPDESAVYSVMAGDSVEITAATTAFGEITSRGRLLDREGQTLAGFVQKYQVWRGSRVLFLEIELDPKVEPQADPWNSYFACRFAWSDESADLFRTVNQMRHPVGGKNIEAPHYVEVCTEAARTAILTGGLPFHRRIGMRMLDSLLIVRGERARRFRLAIGLDLSHPMHEAIGLLSPAAVIPQTAPPPTPSNSGWLFHIDAKNVVATFWEPIFEASRPAGFRVRLLETEGRPARVKLAAFRAVTQARRNDFQGKSLGDCQVEDGQIRLDLTAHEWTEIEAWL